MQDTHLYSPKLYFPGTGNTALIEPFLQTLHLEVCIAVNGLQAEVTVGLCEGCAHDSKIGFYYFLSGTFSCAEVEIFILTGTHWSQN